MKTGKVIASGRCGGLDQLQLVSLALLNFLPAANDDFSDMAPSFSAQQTTSRSPSLVVYDVYQSLTNRAFEICDNGFFNSAELQRLPPPPTSITSLMMQYIVPPVALHFAVTGALMWLVNSLPSSIGESRARYVRELLYDSLIVRFAFPILYDHLAQLEEAEYAL